MRYPKIVMGGAKPLVLSGEAKIVLEVLSAILQKPPVSVVSEALLSFVKALPGPDRFVIEAALKRAIDAEPLDREQSAGDRPPPKETYRYSRLCFKRDVIEKLADEEEFRVVTRLGVFQMSKAEFRRDFSNVRNSRSYKESGFYTYPTLPLRAQRYRISRRAEVGP